MKLFDSQTLSIAADILQIPKEKLYEYACENQLSLAIRLHSTDPFLYESRDGKICERNDFNYCGSDRHVYLYGNLVAVNKDKFLASGDVPLANIIAFNKYPIGHSKIDNHTSMYALNVYQGDKLAYKKWQYEDVWQRQDLVTKLYLTGEAIRHSPLYETIVRNIKETTLSADDVTQNTKLKHVDELVRWSGNGQAQSLVTSCWQAFINNNSHYPLTASELLKYASSHIGLKTEKGEYKGDDRIILSGGGCKWSSFKRLANELIKHSKILKTCKNPIKTDKIR